MLVPTLQLDNDRRGEQRATGGTSRLVSRVLVTEFQNITLAEIGYKFIPNDNSVCRTMPENNVRL